MGPGSIEIISKSEFSMGGWEDGRIGLYLSLTGLLTAIRGLNIYSHLYLRVLSPPGPCQALSDFRKSSARSPIDPNLTKIVWIYKLI